MNRQIMLSFGELYTKGKNRKTFIGQLKGNIKHALDGSVNDVIITHDHMYIRGYDLNKEREIIDLLVDISGIYYINIIEIYQRDKVALIEAALDILARKVGKTFKVFTKRNDKNYPFSSDEINRLIAGEILNKTTWTVDIHQPDFLLEIKIYHNGAYFVVDKILGAGGYPLGIVGQGLLMLSGGLDSPVAAYLTLRRGIRISCIHFASPPYTSEGVIFKLKDLLSALNRYQTKIDLYIIPFTKLQETIKLHVRPAYSITIMRRMMYRLADRLATRFHIPMIINGESIGQVASQTLESIFVINQVTNMPIVRPLAMMDKVAIVELARKIKTYDISIQPFEDCCTIFTPEYPETKPRLKIVEEEEAKFDYLALIEEALGHVEHLAITKGIEE